RSVQLLQAVDHALVPLQTLQVHAGGGQAVEADTALHRADHGIHALVAEHAAEVGFEVLQLQLVIQHHLQYRLHGLVEQAAFDGIVVVLQELLEQLQSGFQIAQHQMDQQLQYKDGQLPPDGVRVELDADKGDDAAGVFQLALFQTVR